MSCVETTQEAAVACTRRTIVAVWWRFVELQPHEGRAALLVAVFMRSDVECVTTVNGNFPDDQHQYAWQSISKRRKFASGTKSKHLSLL